MNKTSSLALLAALALAGASVYFFLYKKQHGPSVSMQKLASVEAIIPVAIIGSGPAGMSAAIYAARANLHTVVFEGKTPGGQLMGTSDVENWPGIGKKRGPEIIEGLKKQAQSFGATFSSEIIKQVDFTSWPYKITTEDGTTAHALSVVIATGGSHRELDVPGEKKYWGGRGVTACATCDAPFFKDKDVVVVGGGDSAAEQALQLASHAKKITVLVRGDKMRASAAMQDRLKVYPHISIRYNTKMIQVVGDEHHVTSVEVQTDGKPETIAVEGVFLAIGHTPNSQMFSPAVACDAQGYILVNPPTQVTSMPGIFAAGDVTDHRYRQAGVASGDGIKAALDAIHFLTGNGYNDVLGASLEKQLFDPGHAETKELMSITDQAHFEREVISSTIPVVVDFYTPYCPSCLQMMPTVSAVAATYDTQVKFVKVDGAKLPELMKKFLISSVPCFLVFKDGLVVGRATSIMTKRELHDFVQKLL